MPGDADNGAGGRIPRWFIPPERPITLFCRPLGKPFYKSLFPFLIVDGRQIGLRALPPGPTGFRPPLPLLITIGVDKGPILGVGDGIAADVERRQGQFMGGLFVVVGLFVIRFTAHGEGSRRNLYPVDSGYDQAGFLDDDHADAGAGVTQSAQDVAGAQPFARRELTGVEELPQPVLQPLQNRLVVRLVGLFDGHPQFQQGFAGQDCGLPVAGFDGVGVRRRLWEQDVEDVDGVA